EHLNVKDTGSDFTNQKNQNSNHNTKKAWQSTADSSDSSKQAAWTSEDWDNWAKQAKWTSDYMEDNDKIPLKLKNLLSIFFRSLNALFSDNYFICKVFFLLVFVLLSCGASKFSTSLQPYSNLVILFYVISWIFFIFFRYYYAPSLWPYLIRTVAGMFYGAILVFLIACFYSVSGADLLRAGLCSAISVWFLLSDFK
ncbi:MAG: hypothetical protein FWE49_00265, partial [Synergistaceae bacterium]|nr:hypothetical protein [Synergistaceae bacterium]